MAAKDNIGDQFRTIYHLSESSTPPHLVDHPEYGKIDDRNVPEKRKGSNDVIFGTEEKGLDMGGERRFMHKYRVPESAISSEIFNDDDAEPTDPAFTPDWQKRPQLWQQVPASRTDALQRGVVTKFVNMAESIHTVGGSIRHPLSYIIPKPHMEKMGVVYEGLEPQESAETYDVVNKRVRKSYGKDTV